ncbi:PaaI family thioesterase [Defluviimonas aestuarii]|uniref:PaaI family thioesterase n=1 Tax=Albidovulum aestuarii TaxID=1130726 RepID=UPI00249A837F|nr:PaaI family thioesterase [Defluviimonas aestuarii]MDI3336526.1 PaaI family thioesterase [Defluviimonas aestuarii]
MTETLAPERDAKVRESFARQRLMTTFGAEITALSPGHCEITAPILPLARQQHDVGHAGLTFALGDTAAGYAALTLMADGAEVMTAEMKVNLLAPAKGDRLIATGRVVKAGRRLSVVTAEVEAEVAGERRLIAVLQGTMVPV